ncbi:MAG: response regulator transcription factor [Lachnospiraceae bacterium]|nr:response regulator transcription factor [Lachnospiraceae bacterium]
MKILLVEDNEDLCSMLEMHFEKAGYETDICHSGAEALIYASNTYYDLFLFDRMLPELDGLSLLKLIRQKENYTPAIFITALEQLNDKIGGLDAGADDYITKPFDISELMARIRAIARRPGTRKDPDILSYKELRLEPEKQILSWQSAEVSLSSTETKMAEVFLKNAGKTLPRAYLINSVWGGNSDINENNLDNYIYFLRKRLRQLKVDVAIKTMHGVGYYME